MFVAPEKVAQVYVAVPASLRNGALSALWSCLESAQREKADSFVFERDRTAYICAHGLLRHALGFKLGLAPDSIRLESSPQGKTRLSTVYGPQPRVHFSLSHVPQLVACVITGTGPCGIDVAPVLTEVPSMGLSATERRDLAALPMEQAGVSFSTMWAVKEAFTKALGTGFDVAPELVETRIWDDPIRVHLVGQRPENWHTEVFAHGDLVVATTTTGSARREIIEIESLGVFG